MKFFDFIITILLLALLGLSMYLLWFNIPGKSIQFEEYFFNATAESIPPQHVQFYPNMRFRSKNINYSISDQCDAGKLEEIEEGFSFISDKTILKFSKVKNDGEIKVFCSDISPTPEEEGHFVAGEGGPSEIIDVENYAVIFSGKISLFRKSSCQKPNIAIHEILHALGFDHNNNQRSIMYPITDCSQTLDQYIIDEINKLYSIKELPDLTVERISAEKSGVYLKFKITIANLGLKDSSNSVLSIYAGDELIKEFDLESFDIGARKILSVDNLRVSRNSNSITFEIKSSDNDLNKENNVVNLALLNN
ncbi:MAG: matrixin family metalloprotease [Nanoarchaeota archaeon]